MEALKKLWFLNHKPGYTIKSLHKSISTKIDDETKTSFNRFQDNLIILEIEEFHQVHLKNYIISLVQYALSLCKFIKR